MGGINYKDIQSQIKALNSKYIINLNKCKSKRSILPKYWILNFFQQTSNIKEVDKPYFNNFIEQNFDIVTQCSFKLPRKNKWKGHPFYYDQTQIRQPKKIGIAVSLNRCNLTVCCEFSTSEIRYIYRVVFLTGPPLKMTKCQIT